MTWSKTLPLLLGAGTLMMGCSPPPLCEDVELTELTVSADGMATWEGGDAEYIFVQREPEQWFAQCSEGTSCISPPIDITQRLESTGSFSGEPSIDLVPGDIVRVAVGNACDTSEPTSVGGEGVETAIEFEWE